MPRLICARFSQWRLPPRNTPALGGHGALPPRNLSSPCRSRSLPCYNAGICYLIPNPTTASLPPVPIPGYGLSASHSSLYSLTQLSPPSRPLAPLYAVRHRPFGPSHAIDPPFRLRFPGQCALCDAYDRRATSIPRLPPSEDFSRPSRRVISRLSAFLHHPRLFRSQKYTSAPTSRRVCHPGLLPFFANRARAPPPTTTTTTP